MSTFKIGDKVCIKPVWEGLPRAGTGTVAWVTREREFTPEHIATAAYGDAYTPARCRPTAHPKYFVRRDNPRDPEHPFLVTISTLPLELISEVELNTGTNMSTIQLSVGEWKMRNGEKAVVEYHHKGAAYPWCGYVNEKAQTWSGDGKYCRTLSITEHDIIAPWTSPIAPGHNPDKLTVEQVGEGYWLPEWEVLSKIPPHKRIEIVQFWNIIVCEWQSPVCSQIGNEETYRTRLTREELLKLIAPKKRLIRVEELPAVCWVSGAPALCKDRVIVTGVHIEQQRVFFSRIAVGVKELHEQNSKYSSDLKTWHSFEVEDKE